MYLKCDTNKKKSRSVIEYQKLGDTYILRAPGGVRGKSWS